MTQQITQHVYKLIRGGIVLGLVTHESDDQPYHFGTFTPTNAFDRVRDLFEQEITLLESEGATGDWRDARNRIDEPGLTLEPYEAVGKAIFAPLLHIKGSDVWWR